jgi:hypothetical protein
VKRSPLAKESKNPTAECKKRIQSLLRQLAIRRDGGCVLRKDVPPGYIIPACNGYAKNGELVFQYDHLNSRAFNVSYADIRLGVILCKGHHGWKHFTDHNKKLYDEIMRKMIEPKRRALWDAVENDRKSYPMGIYEWGKVEMALNNDLKGIEKNRK